MLRKIVDHKKLDHTLAALLIETYPDDYGDEDIIAFKNIHNEIVEKELEFESKPDPILEEVGSNGAEIELNNEVEMGRVIGFD